MTSCATCARAAARDTGSAPDWDCIVRSAHWDLVHAYDSRLLGWMVLAARRHITSVAELTTDEATELGLAVRDVSLALTTVMGAAKTYIVQFAEHPNHPHVHVHVVARLADHPPAWIGPGVFGALGAPEDERVSEADMNDLAERLRRALATHPYWGQSPDNVAR